MPFTVSSEPSHHVQLYGFTKPDATDRVAVLGIFNIYGLWYIFKNKMFVKNIGNTFGLATRHYDRIRNAKRETKLFKHQRSDIVENWANEICTCLILFCQRTVAFNSSRPTDLGGGKTDDIFTQK